MSGSEAEEVYAVGGSESRKLCLLCANVVPMGAALISTGPQPRGEGRIFCPVVAQSAAME